MYPGKPCHARGSWKSAVEYFREICIPTILFACICAPWQCLCISGVGVAQETNTACGLSEEASMLFTEGIALNDVENMRVSSAAYRLWNLFSACQTKAFYPTQTDITQPSDQTESHRRRRYRRLFRRCIGGICREEDRLPPELLRPLPRQPQGWRTAMR